MIRRWRVLNFDAVTSLRCAGHKSRHSVAVLVPREPRPRSQR